MKILFLLILCVCLALSVSAQDKCQETIANYTVLLLKMPMPSADNTKEQNKFIFDNRKEIKKIWKKNIQKECGFNQTKWYEKAFLLIPLLAILLK